ncbi:MAG: shikimate dehydrogenase [Croceibacterium sp.]
MTAYAEVIGDPIAQSKSPVIHRFWLGKLGLAADYRACHTVRGGAGDYLAERRSDPDWRGCNVTMPHKQAVMPLLDRLDPLAERIGAVNTIVPDGEHGVTGYNTDAAGFLEPLRPLLANRHLFRMARVFGTGGAARAIVAALASEHFVLVLAGRDLAKAQAILDELGAQGDHHAADIGHFAAPTDFAFDDRGGCLDLVVNASSLGMVGEPPLLVHLSHVPPGSVVFDIVTHPLETPLLTAARGAGLRTIDGLAMLLGQAAAAFEKFFGAPAPRQYDAELRALLTR